MGFKMKKLSILGVALLTLNHWAYALSPAVGNWESVQQDGKTLEIRLQGDVNHHWYETRRGYVVANEGGQWFYVDSDHRTLSLVSPDELPPSGALLAQEERQSFKPHLDMGSGVKLNLASKPGDFRVNRSMSVHEQNLLVVRVSFLDAEAKIKQNKDDVEKLFFGYNNSVKSYYSDNTYQKLRIKPVKSLSGESVIDVSLNQKHPNVKTAGTWPKIEERLLNALDPEIDFSQYDKNKDARLTPDELSLVVVMGGFERAVSTPGTPSVWSHQSTTGSSKLIDGVKITAYTAIAERDGGTDYFKLGVAVHELGHLMLGLPDLYGGYGSWGLMASAHQGSEPAQLSGWSKKTAGIIDYKEMPSNREKILRLSPAHLSEDVYRLWIDPYKHLEYLVLEHRQDDMLLNYRIPQSNGLLVSHVNEAVVGGNAKNTEKLIKAAMPINEMLGHSLFELTNIAANVNDPLTFYIKNVGLSQVSANAEVFIEDQEKGILSYSEETYSNGNYSYNLAGEHIIEYQPNTHYVDGVDISTHGVTSLSLSIYATKTDVIQDKPLESVTTNVLENGWNRVFFQNSIDVKKINKLYLKINVIGGGIVYENGLVDGSYYNIWSGKLYDRNLKNDLRVALLVSKTGQANRAPKIGVNTLPDVKVGSVITFSLSNLKITDPDGDDITLEITSVPVDVIKLSELMYRVNPSFSTYELVFGVRATDSKGKSTSANVKVKIKDDNHAPTVNKTSFEVRADEFFHLTLRNVGAFDQEGDRLELNWLNKNDSNIAYKHKKTDGYQISFKNIGRDYSVDLYISVSDGLLDTKATVSVKVIAPAKTNQAPKINKTKLELKAGVTYEMSMVDLGVWDDQGLNDLSFDLKLSNLAEKPYVKLMKLSSKKRYQLLVDKKYAGTEFKLIAKVTDAGGLFVEKDITVRVKAEQTVVNQYPKVEVSVFDIAAGEKLKVDLESLKASDPEGDTLSIKSVRSDYDLNIKRDTHDANLYWVTPGLKWANNKVSITVSVTDGLNILDKRIELNVLDPISDTDKPDTDKTDTDKPEALEDKDSDRSGGALSLWVMFALLLLVMTPRAHFRVFRCTGEGAHR